MTFDLISGLHMQIQTWHPPLRLCTHAPPPGFKSQQEKGERWRPPPGFKGEGQKAAPPPGFKGEELGQGDSTTLPAGSKRQVTESELEEPPAKAVKTGKYKKSYFMSRELRKGSSRHSSNYYVREI